MAGAVQKLLAHLGPEIQDVEEGKAKKPSPVHEPLICVYSFSQTIHFR